MELWSPVCNKKLYELLGSMWLRSRSTTNTKLYDQGVTNEMRRHIVVLGLPPECFLLLHVGWQPAAVPGWPAPILTPATRRSAAGGQHRYPAAFVWLQTHPMQ